MNKYDNTNNQNNNNNISILNWNTAGFTKEKYKNLKYFLSQNDITIVILTESHLKHNQKPQRIKNYKFTYFNRQLNNVKQKGGGVIIYYKANLGAEPITDTEFDNRQINRNTTEIAGIKLANNTRIYGIYHPPADELNIQIIEQLLSDDKTLIIGDLNARHVNWNNPVNNRNGNILNNYIENNPIMLYHPEEHTYSRINTKSTIDITLSNNIPIHDISTIPDLISDHYPVIMYTKQSKPAPISYRKIKDFDNANWAQYQAFLATNWTMKRELNTKQEIDQTIDDLTNTIQNASNLAIPDKKQNGETYTQDIHDAIKLRNKYRRNFQKQPNHYNKDLLDAQNKLVNTLLNTFHTHLWEKRINQINDNKNNIWQILRQRKRQDNTYIPTIRQNNNTYALDEEKANILSNHFNKYNTPITPNQTDAEIDDFLQEQQNHPADEEIEVIKLTPAKVKAIIRSIRPYKAPGNDNIQGKHLKKLPKKLVVQLYYIYKGCLKLNYFPNKWKIAIITPIYKAGKQQNSPDGYRPISLLSILGKILEKIINNEIQNFLQDNNVIIPEQFGFRPKHTTTLQTARIVHKSKLHFNLKKVTTMVALDLKNAFETVWHKGLIFKMHNYNFPIKIIKIIESYLKNRSNKTVVNGKFSHTHNQTRGVPQGGTLSATLFIIYINDIPKKPDTHLALFADDTSIYSTSKRTRTTHTRINNHLQELEQYFNKWKISINPEKTQFINFGHTKQQQNHNIIKTNNTVIQPTNVIKYLGIHLDKKLTFHYHIQKLIQRGNAILHFLYPFINKNSNLSQKLKITLYKVYTQTVLLYATPIWSSASLTNLKKLQTFENRMYRIILGKKTSEITNKEIFERIEEPPILHKMYQLWQKFFQFEIQNTPLTSHINDLNPQNVPFRVKHKLINYRMHENDDQ